jgi:hypothetical protein
MLKTSRLGAAKYLIFLLPLAIYLYKYQLQEMGADFFLRITEARYFLARINPYDVFMDLKPIVDAYGPKPAAYSFFSYFFAGLLTKITTSLQVQLFIFLCLDYLALVLGIVLFIKMNDQLADSSNRPASLHSRVLILTLVLVCSTFFWQHVYFLNYTLISTFGLLLLIYGLSKKGLILPLLGMGLIGLRPSLAIPVFLFLAVNQRWRILSLSVAGYLLVLLLSSWRLGANPLELVKQLGDIQRHFSDNLSYYHAEGLLLSLKPFVGTQLTVAAAIITGLIMVHYRKHLSNPLVSILLITACSVSLFYTQVHAWISIYPILLVALSPSVKSKHSIIIIAILIGFLVIPRLSGQIPEEYRYQYIVAHNLVRFGGLWYCVIHLVNQLIANARQGVHVHRA